MTKNKSAYQVMIIDAQARLTGPEKLVSKILHSAAVDLVLRNLDRTLFRIVPLQFGLVASVTVGILMIGIAYFYGYKINSLSMIFNVFILGYILGALYEYVHTMIRQVK